MKELTKEEKQIVKEKVKTRLKNDKSLWWRSLEYTFSKCLFWAACVLTSLDVSVVSVLRSYNAKYQLGTDIVLLVTTGFLFYLANRRLLEQIYDEELPHRLFLSRFFKRFVIVLPPFIGMVISAGLNAPTWVEGLWLAFIWLAAFDAYMRYLASDLTYKDGRLVDTPSRVSQALGEASNAYKNKTKLFNKFLTKTVFSFWLDLITFGVYGIYGTPKRLLTLYYTLDMSKRKDST